MRERRSGDMKAEQNPVFQLSGCSLIFIGRFMLIGENLVSEIFICVF